MDDPAALLAFNDRLVADPVMAHHRAAYRARLAAEQAAERQAEISRLQPLAEAGTGGRAADGPRA